MQRVVSIGSGHAGVQVNESLSAVDSEPAVKQIGTRTFSRTSAGPADRLAAQRVLSTAATPTLEQVAATPFSFEDFSAQLLPTR